MLFCLILLLVGVVLHYSNFGKIVLLNMVLLMFVLFDLISILVGVVLS